MLQVLFGFSFLGVVNIIVADFSNINAKEIALSYIGLSK